MTQTESEIQDDIARAVAAAEAIFDDPGIEASYEPVSSQAARAAVDRLGRLFETAPGALREALDGARAGGEMLSSDPFQGLSEIVQNADDVGATRVAFYWRENELIAVHDGRPVNLKDALALATPWLTTKRRDPQSIGRFGIGLVTLRSLSSVLDVISWPYALRITGSKLVSIEHPAEQDIRDSRRFTTFRIPLESHALSAADLKAWLARWDETALMFCRHVAEVTVEVPDGTLDRLKLRWSDHRESGGTVGGEEVATEVATAHRDARQWRRWTAEIAPPPGLERQHKDVGKKMPIGIAVPLHTTDGGHVHAGLPLADIGVRLLVNGLFDPIAGRQGLLDNAWNSALVELLADLWVAVVLSVFETDTRDAWRLIPLPDEVSSDGVIGKLEAAILDRARSEVAHMVTIATPMGPLSLADLAVEVEELEGILEVEQISKLASTAFALPPDARDLEARWRKVLDDWRSDSTALPEPVTVLDALELLDEDLAVQQAISIAAAALEKGLDQELARLAWIPDETGERHVPPPRESLWVFTTTSEPWASDLDLARIIHPAFQASDPATDAVRAWLKNHGSFTKSVDAESLLKRLAAAGTAGAIIAEPLTDEQLLSIRDAMEGLAADTRKSLGPGLGRAIQIRAFTYGAGGKRTALSASPSQVYLPRQIDREPDSFAIAAHTTTGLVWADPKYSQALRSPLGRAGLGPQRFLRLLGAEIAPRVESHGDMKRRYADSRLGLPARWLPGGPPKRSEHLASIGAEYTLDDSQSPDLDLVLRSIANDPMARRRRSRAAAVLATLGRAWDRIGDQAEVAAAAADYGWVIKQSSPAYWVWQARSIEWLDNESAVPSPPSELSLRTPAALAVHGPDSPDFLHRDLKMDRHEILNVLGVTGEPTMKDMVDRLGKLRDGEEAATDESIEGDVVLLYRSIADQIGNRRQTPGQLTATQLRKRFASDSGLIRTNHGWQPPNTVLSGPPVFGTLRTFVPQVPGADPLWRTLGVPAPTLQDCVAVLRQLAGLDNAGDVAFEGVELDTLRQLAELVSTDPPAPRTITMLRKLGLRTSQGRRTARPIFALADPIVAKAVGDRLPVWTPGGELDQFAALVEPLGITVIDPVHVMISGTDAGSYDEEATVLFRAAVAQLHEDLVRNDPAAASSLRIDWSDFESFDVILVSPLSVQVKPPNGTRRPVVGPVAAFANTETAHLYLLADDQLDAYEGGARAIANLFDSDARRIAQAWLAACATARAGHEAHRLELAAIRSVEEKRRREVALDDQLQALKNATAAKPTIVAPSKARQNRDSDTDQSHEERRSRHLVDSESLSIVNPEGEIIGEGTVHASTPKPPKSPRTELPKPKPGGAPIQSRTSPRSYTDLDREDLGLELARRVLRSDDEDLADLRGQRGVGADAIDELRRFYELKVYGGPEPDRINLEPSQFKRAATTLDFFLVVVSNVEEGYGNPTVRIITDPLNQLAMSETRAISLSGVRSARSLIYRLARKEDSRGDGHGQE